MDAIIKHRASQLSESDLDILNSPSYLNDEIIGFYFTYLASITESDDVLFIPPAVSDLLANADDVDVVKASIEPLEFGTKNLIFFAVNDSLHWSLLVFDRRVNEFMHHDSMEGANNVHAVKLFNAVKDFVVVKVKESGKSKKLNRSKKASVSSKAATPPSFKECPTPQQANGYDCGLFVLAIAKAVCEWHCSKKKCDYWFKEKEVNAYVVESSLRSEIMSLINDFRVGD